MTFINQTKPSLGDGTRIEDISIAIDNVNDIESRLSSVSSSQILNGSFELFSNGVPTSWVSAIASGKSLAVVSGVSNTQHGNYAVKLTNASASSGEVSLTSENFLEVGENKESVLSWFMKSDTSTVTNSVAVNYYDNSQSLLSTDTLYNVSSGNSLSWIQKAAKTTPPTNARYSKIKIVGVNSSVNGSVWFDGFEYLTIPKRETGSQMFTTSGTFIVPSGCYDILARLVGGGGNGAAGGTGGFGGFGQTTPVNPTPGGRGGDGGFGGSGGGGAYQEYRFQVSPGDSFIAVPGGPGNATTITYNSIIYSGNNGAAGTTGTNGADGGFNGITGQTGAYGTNGGGGTLIAGTYGIPGAAGGYMYGGTTPLGVFGQGGRGGKPGFGGTPGTISTGSAGTAGEAGTVGNSGCAIFQWN